MAKYFNLNGAIPVWIAVRIDKESKYFLDMGTISQQPDTTLEYAVDFDNSDPDFAKENPVIGVGLFEINQVSDKSSFDFYYN